MSDLEIVKLCAAAMGLPEITNPDPRALLPEPPSILVEEPICGLPVIYDPLTNDGQAMALIHAKKLSVLSPTEHHANRWTAIAHVADIVTMSNSLNRAICECVARVQVEKA